MPTIIMTKGLPASGKTTWAKEEVRTKPNTKRVNKDDLRAMLNNGKWSKSNEEFVLDCRDWIVAETLIMGDNIIVDDTNLDPKHEARLRDLAKVYKADFEIQSFLEVPLATCLTRDEARAASVGERVIKQMYNRYLKPEVKMIVDKMPIPINPDLPPCLIVDIDGTLAHGTGRSPYDYSRVHEDAVDERVRDIVQTYSNKDMFTGVPKAYIVVVSGREDSCKAVTEQWLKDNDIPYDEIYMRKAGDKREDSIVKYEIYQEFIEKRFNVLFVLDDRDRVVKMWRENGLKVLQVAPGDF